MAVSMPIVLEIQIVMKEEDVMIHTTHRFVWIANLVGWDLHVLIHVYMEDRNLPIVDSANVIHVMQV